MPFHPQLSVARYMPRFSFGPRLLKLVRVLMRHTRPKSPPPGMQVEQIETPSMRLFRPANAKAPAPAFLWLHGGGYIFGRPEHDDAITIAIASQLGIVAAHAR